jgi:hypothetical protein
MTAPTSARSRVKKLRALQDAEPGVYLSALVLHEAPSVLPAVVLPVEVGLAWALLESQTYFKIFPLRNESADIRKGCTGGKY